MVKIRTLYGCEYCGLEDEIREVAEACEAMPMERLPYKVGDIVAADGGYGWWHADKMDWMHTEHGGLPSPGDGKTGWPLFVVLAIVPNKIVRPHETGRWAHMEKAILFSPKHANRVPDHKAMMATNGIFKKVRDTTPEELAALRADAIATFSDGGGQQEGRLVTILESLGEA